MEEIIKKYNFEKKLQNVYQLWIDDYCNIIIGLTTKTLRFTFGPNSSNSFIHKKFETIEQVEKILHIANRPNPIPP